MPADSRDSTQRGVCSKRQLMKVAIKDVDIHKIKTAISSYINWLDGALGFISD